MLVRGVLVAMGLFCLCGIMFFTGVMVGRGTAPVEFDTRSFQKKLAEMANRENNDNPPEKTKLAFYNELKKKISTDFVLSEVPELTKDDAAATSDTSGSEVSDVSLPQEPVPMKKALKTRTRDMESIKNISGPQQELQEHENRSGNGKNPTQLPEKPERRVVSHSQGAAGYTIQISSFRQLLDAIKRMEALKVKGFTPHRSLAIVDGNVWHRVRVGTYPDSVSAEKALKILESRGVYGIIIQKE